MTYQYREERRVIENDGNIGLFVDSGNLIYTEIDGKKVYFYFESVYPGQPIPRAWWGYSTWSFYAAERVDDYIKIIDRTWAKPNSLTGALSDKTSQEYADTFYYEIIYYTLDGKLVSKDFPSSDPFGLLLNPRAYRYGVESHANYIESLAYRLNSPLEQWVMNDKSILQEFIENEDKRILLEDWAYHKYVELYPGEKVPSTYGIEGNYPSGENAYFGKKTLTGNFRDYKFYNRGSGKYEIKTDSGFDEITGMSLEFADQNIDAADDIKGVFDQITGLNTDSGKMFRLYNAAFARFQMLLV